MKYGGEGGIRTPDTLASMPHFECGAFNRSATSPTVEMPPLFNDASGTFRERVQAQDQRWTKRPALGVLLPVLEHARQECPGDTRRGSLRIARGMAVNAKRHCGIGVAKPCTDCRYWDAGLQQQRGVSVPQIVKAEPSQAELGRARRKRLADRPVSARLRWIEGRRWEDQRPLGKQAAQSGYMPALDVKAALRHAYAPTNCCIIRKCLRCFGTNWRAA